MIENRNTPSMNSSLLLLSIIFLLYNDIDAFMSPQHSGCTVRTTFEKSTLLMSSDAISGPFPITDEGEYPSTYYFAKIYDTDTDKMRIYP
jgi:hypothetical protein